MSVRLSINNANGDIMRDLDPGAVHAFVLIAELQSFTRAAEVLNTTQAAISTKLKRLENRLGRQLLERTPRTVRLSAAGAAFLEPAREILAAQQRAKAVFTTPSRRFALGISHHLVGSSLPAILRKAANTERSIVLELRIGMTRELIEEYEARALDAIVLLRHSDNRRGGQRLTLERFGWFAAPDFSFTPGTPLPLATQAAPCSLRAMATEQLDAAGIKWREVFVGGGAAIVGAAVEAGIGVAALSPRVAPAGLVDVGKRLGLPSLPTRDVVVHSRTEDAGLNSSISLLTATFRNGA
jgi:DNA-binding transcriptional LysR family regulator